MESLEFVNDLKDTLITYTCERGTFDTTIQHAYPKEMEQLEKDLQELAQYRALAEQIGCPLEVRCNLDINDRIIDMFGIEYVVRSIGKKDFIGYDVKKMKKNEIYRELFKWKEYKVTWWLKADKSE